jgi:RHS repeat-associated protein
VSKVYANVANANTDYQIRQISATFDGNSNPLVVTEVKVRAGATITETTAFTYDALDRVQSRTRRDHDDASGLTVAYDYDAVGNRTAVTDPDNKTTTYTYDALNRLATVTAEAGTTTYQWWEDDLPKAIVYPNGTWQDLAQPGAYDRADRLTQVASGPVGPAQPFSVFTYAYDAAGNRVSQVEVQQALNGGQPMTTTYSYDPSHRLTQVSYGAQARAYTYDAVGNRLSEQGTDPVGGALDRTFQYDRINSLTRITDNNIAANSIDYEFDANRNLTAKVKNGQRSEFVYDVRDQLIAATVNGATTRFDYDASSMRVKKIGDGSETRYLYDERSVLLEYDGALATTAKYDYGYALLALSTANPVPGQPAHQFYMLDGLGSTANLADENGNLVQSYRYDAFGRTLDQAGSSSNARLYTGHYRDGETGLDYFGARYYDPEIGRFLTQDAYQGQPGSPPSLHRYLYANANPLRYIDPTGYASVEANSGGLMTALGSAVESTSGPRGYYSRSYKPGEMQNLKGWINDENPHRPGVAAVDEDAMTGAWAGDTARRFQKWAAETKASLEELAMQYPNFATYVLYQQAAFGLDVASGISGALKLGEGAAAGLDKLSRVFEHDANGLMTGFNGELLLSGAGDLMGDAMRLYDLAGPGGLVRGVARGSVMFGKAIVGETLPAITKKVGQKMLPMTVVAPAAERAVHRFSRETGLEIGVRAVDPITSLTSRIGASRGWSMPKPMHIKEKTVFGMTRGSNMQWYHSDADIAWVRATKTIYASDGKTILLRKGAYLTDDQVLKYVVDPLNAKLPPSMHFQHGAHFASHKAFGGPLDYTDFGKFPGHPGPVSVYSGDSMKMMSIREVEQYAMGGNRLPWHPDWNKTKPLPTPNLGVFGREFSPMYFLDPIRHAGWAMQRQPNDK